MHFLLIKPIPASNRIPDQLLLSITPKRSKEQSPQYPCASKYIRKKVSNSVIPNFHWFFLNTQILWRIQTHLLTINQELCGQMRDFVETEGFIQSLCCSELRLHHQFYSDPESNWSWLVMGWKSITWIAWYLGWQSIIQATWYTAH